MPKSPTSQRRLSTSSLDEVSLIDELPSPKEAVSAAPELPPVAVTSPASIVESIAESITNRFSRSSTASSQNSTTTSKAVAPVLPPGKLSTPTQPPLPPTPPAAAAPQPPPPPPIRRSPFSWLRSSPSTPTTATASSNSAQSNSRRATASSIATLASVASNAPTMQGNNESWLHALESEREEKENEAARGTQNLRENFKKIREAREGMPVPADEDKDTIGKGSVFSAIGFGGTPTTPLQEDTPPPGSAPATVSSIKEDEIDWDLWQAVVDDADNVASEKPAELSQAVQAGIPPTLRGTIWQSMASSKSLELEAMYRDVVALPGTATSEDARPIFGSHWLWDPSPTSQSSSPKLGSLASLKLDPRVKSTWGKTVTQLEKVIKKDLGERTSFGKYKVDQKALMGVCKAYALFDPEVGYTQGMTFIATVLLLNMTEEEAFCIFVKLMNKYKLRTMFQDRMKGLELRLFQYDRILEDYEPKLAIHLKRQGIESSLYAAQWFLTLFTYKFPLQLVLRVFDLLFSEGLEGPILKFGIVMMGKNATTLLGMEFDNLGPFLKERLFDVYLDVTPSASSVKEAGFFGNGGEKEVYRANLMVQDACAIKISQETLDRYEREWEEIVRVKRDAEQELETLKRANLNSTLKVKKLEEQNEELNREYVRIASSEVELKVLNDQLADENEELKTKVEMLKESLDRQPQEIEDRFREEMRILMEKNLAVHTENQTLEENMMEMEKELVSTKMQLATINEDYDLLKNRWNDLKKALGD
ncbi:rab-GTPase-TBC domain-containing protein [Morchella snyderi]|nr:rab-GTPase-TBC domain-containing protein [Morchella snyderi]